MSVIEIAALSGESLTNISDYSRLAPFLWLEGLKPSFDGKYPLEYPPQLVQTDLSHLKVFAGRRPEGSLEKIVGQIRWDMPPYEENNFIAANDSLSSENFRRRARMRSITGPRERSDVPTQAGLKSKSVQARLAERQRRLVEDYYGRQSASSSVSDAPAERVSDLQTSNEDNDVC